VLFGDVVEVHHLQLVAVRRDVQPLEVLAEQARE